MGNKQISTEGVNMRFQDKIAIVTGGASGIGKEVATRFVAEGGSVVINDRDRAKAEAAARQIDPGGKRAVVHVEISPRRPPEKPPSKRRSTSSVASTCCSTLQ
jgi:NAD(P)-dependent dehydrogenase (short-subunit alcohol dehydrogenase family)